MVSNEILTEYLEKCVEKFGPDMAKERLDFLLEFPNVNLVSPTYRWNLIDADPDDNKFVDCAISGQADFIVTHDKHFQMLNDIPFPKVSTVRLDVFQQILEG